MHQNSNGNYSGSRLGWLSSSLLISVFPILFLQQTLNSLCNKRGKAHYNHPEGLKTNAEELVNNSASNAEYYPASTIRSAVSTISTIRSAGKLFNKHDTLIDNSQTGYIAWSRNV